MMIARLKPGVTTVQAQDAMHAYFRQHMLERFRGGFPPDQLIETELVPAGKGLSQMREEYRGALLALMALVTIVLFTTCTNVGNLLMLRNAARRRELTVRAALGAGRSRLILQYLVESTLLAVIGCALGLAFAAWGVSLILSMLPLPAIPESLAFHADARILGFAAGVSLFGALLFGLVPAWRATEVDLTGTLRSSHGTTAPKSARRLGRVLVACQVGLSVLLLVGAGLFVRTLRNLSYLDLGYSIDRLLAGLDRHALCGLRRPKPAWRQRRGRRSRRRSGRSVSPASRTRQRRRRRPFRDGVAQSPDAPQLQSHGDHAAWPGAPR